MRRVGLASGLIAAATAWGAEPVEGRWEGVARIPGRDVRVIVDLARDGAGAWTGSAIFPDLGIHGAPVGEIAVGDGRVSFVVKGALGGPTIAGRVEGERFEGDFRQGGNIAPVELRNAGVAQVEPPRKGGPITKEMAGEWNGEMNFMGRALKVRLSLGGAAKLVIIGRRENVFTPDFVSQEGSNLTVEVSEAGFRFEGRLRAGGEIAGVFSQGPVETELAVRK